MQLNEDLEGAETKTAGRREQGLLAYAVGRLHEVDSQDVLGIDFTDQNAGFFQPLTQSGASGEPAETVSTS